MLDAGSYQFTENMDLGWGGEALGTGAAAMTIEGNWIRGAMTNDYPDINYRVVELPNGPSGHRGSMAFTNAGASPRPATSRTPPSTSSTS